MKTTFKFIIAAMAASAVSVSCQKEVTTDNPVSPADGIRVISASFSAPTKSALDTDNKTPKFVGGETIKVSNATASEDCTINVNEGVATFSTSLTGELTAVYPSTAAKMDGDVIDNSTVLVTTVQDGTFASANIAMATGITTSATFTNKTALIKITPGAGSNTKYVEVIASGAEIANTVPTESPFTKLNKIHVNTTSADPVYVSILVPSGLKIQNLSFADGNSVKTAKDNTTAVAANTINTVSSTGWDMAYVEIGGVKWTTMNIGATTVAGSFATCAGYYYQWGSLNTLYESISWGGTSATFSFKSGKTSGYVAGNKEYTASANLPIANDIANKILGGDWRMPTKAEFESLYYACGSGGTVDLESATPGKGLYWLKADQILISEYAGVAGCLFVDDSGNRLFFPAAGYGTGTKLSKSGEQINYWSSTYCSGSGSSARAYSLRNVTSGLNPSADMTAHSGFNIRPVLD